MPAVAESDPFADLVPENLIGGENGAPAHQVVGAEFSEVPRAEVNTPTEFGAFADLIPQDQPSARSMEGIGPFDDLVPKPQTETEKALAETPDWVKTLREGADVTARGESQPITRTGGPDPNDQQVPGFGEFFFDPKVNLPRLEHKPEDSLVIRAGKSVANVAGEFISGVSSPAMLAAAVPMLVATAPGLVSHQVTRIKEADNTPAGSPERMEAALSTVALIAGPPVAYALSKALQRRAPVRPASEPEAPPPITERPRELPKENSESFRTEPIRQPESTVPLSDVAGDVAALPETQSRPIQTDPMLRQTSQPEITKPVERSQTEPIGVTETIAELERRNAPNLEPVIPKEPAGTKFPEPVEKPPAPVGNDWTEATAEPVRRPRQYNTSDGGFAEHPLIQFIQGDMGGIMSKSTARRKLGKEKFTANQSVWDDAPVFTDPRHNKVYDARSGQAPDVVAGAAAEVGLLPDGASSVELWSALDNISRSSKAIAKSEWVENAKGREAEKMAKSEPEFLPPEDVPTLRPGEKQGDIFSRQTEDLTLAGEKGIDYGARQAAAERTAAEVESARKAQDALQTTLDDHATRLKLKANKKGGFVNADIFREAADFGARLYQKGVTYGKWAKDMIRHLGAGIKEHLTKLWQTVRDITGDERGSIGGNIGLKISGKHNDLNTATMERSARLQKSFADAERAQHEIKKAVPSERRQNAMSVWIEAKGDPAVLAQWEAAGKGKAFKRAAKEAQALKPAEIAMAQKVGQTFAVLESRGNRYDVLRGHQENYVPHVWDVTKKFSGIGSSKLQDRFKFAKARSFETFFDGDQAGFVPKTLAIGRLLPSYLHEMNTVIADRQFVQDVSAGVAKDSRPLVIPRGNAKTVDTSEYAVMTPGAKRASGVFDTEAEARAVLQPGQTIQKRPSTSAIVNPRGFASAKDPAGNPIDQSGYAAVDQPALTNWRWVETDPAGNATILKSDLAVHPELAKRMKSMMGQSEFRKWYNEPSTGGLSVLPKAIIKGLDTAQATMKREMFGLLAPFHQVQEGTHAIGHTVNPFFGIPDMSRPTAAHLDAMRHGLMIKPEKTAGAQYLEGLGGRNTFISQVARKLGTPVGRAVANLIDGYQNYLFHQYIPGLKFKTYEHIVERNMKRYEKELASGEVTPGDVKMLSAEQSNAAYGHLNYALLDRNPTMQHIIQILALAPDFLEARSRFAAQALKPSKAGFEQFRAIAFLAAVQAGSSFLISKLLGEEWDPRHPFEVTHNNRTYFLRSVPEDLFRLFFSGADKSREFISARVNPMTQKAWQAVSGLNYRGEKVGFLDTIGELLANYIPITARVIPGINQLTETSRNNPVSPLEQLMGSFGLKVSRYSPISKTYQLAHEWKKAEGVDDDKGSYPVSKYQQLRYALEDSDRDKAITEYQKLRNSGMVGSKISSGFKESIHHSFTGSKANDEKFRKSLNPYQRGLHDLAVQRRKDIIARYNKMTWPVASAQ